MSDVYSDDYGSVAGPDRDRLVPDSLRRLAGAALFVVLVGAMALWAYRLGTRDAADVPIIRAMEGPSRIQPENPGGLQAAHQGLEVNSVLAGEPAPAPAATPRVAPPSVALAEEDGPQGELVLAAPATLDEASLGVDADLRMPLQDEPLADGDPGAAMSADATTPVPAADAEAAAVLAAVLGELPSPDEEAAAAPDAQPSPRPLRRPSNLVVARAPAPPAPSAAATRPAEGTRPAAQQAATPPAATPAPAPTAREVRSVPAGARMVQLGAYDNEALTRQAWERLVARNGDLLGSRSLYVERTTANARVFYRLRVAGFDNAEQTRVMCEQLRARGVDCIPVTLQ